MVGCHHQLSGHEFEKPLGNSKGQGSLACCSPWGHKELDTTYWLNNNNHYKVFFFFNPSSKGMDNRYRHCLRLNLGERFSA